MTGMDARVKLVALAVTLALIITSPGVLMPAFALIVSLALALYAGASLRSLLLRFLEPAFIVLVLVGFKSLSGAHEIYNIFGIALYSEGLMEGLRMALRIASAVSAVAAVTFCTPVAELLHALRWMRVPSTLTEVALFAYRYIAGFHEEARVIYSAQRGRLGYDGLGRSLGSAGMMCGSLMLRALDQAESTALAMKQRGYDGQMPAHHFDRPTLREISGAAALCLAMAALWWLGWLK